MKKSYLINRLPQIVDLIEKAIRFFNADIDENKKRHGCYLTIIDSITGEIFLILAIGSFPPEKAVKYFHHSLDKGMMLFNNQGKYLTSLACPDALDECSQGAVMSNGLIWSISGQEQAHNESIAAIASFQFPLWHIYGEKKPELEVSERAIELFDIMKANNQSFMDLQQFLNPADRPIFIPSFRVLKSNT